MAVQTLSVLPSRREAAVKVRTLQFFLFCVDGETVEEEEKMQIYIKFHSELKFMAGTLKFACFGSGADRNPTERVSDWKRFRCN